MPKGGGAIWGIGEKFPTDLRTGIGNFTVPIALSPEATATRRQLDVEQAVVGRDSPLAADVWGTE